MKKITTYFVVLLFFNTVLSQVGIGTTLPTGALDINSSTNGLVIPRVALISKIATSPVVNPQGGALTNGTMVYNTATAGTAPNNVVPGFYYWNLPNLRWERSDNGTKTETSYSSPVVEPNSSIPGSCSGLAIAGTNILLQSFDNTTVTKTINLSGFTGIICNITCNVQLTHSWASDIDLYLQSPTGQIIELSTDNGGFSSTVFNVTFSDAGASNITTWPGGTVLGTYRPEGSLTTDVIIPNITTMSGFNGNSPNGTWTLHARDDAGSDTFNFISYTLSISTTSTLSYRLVSQAQVIYKQGHSIIANATYSGNSFDNEGVITALTRSTVSPGGAGTLVANLPTNATYTKLSYASDSPRQGSGNYWVSTFNQGLSNGLVDGTTYYFQLWVKGNIETPLTSNEQWSLIPVQMQN